MQKRVGWIDEHKNSINFQITIKPKMYVKHV